MLTDTSSLTCCHPFMVTAALEPLEKCCQLACPAQVKAGQDQAFWEEKVGARPIWRRMIHTWYCLNPASLQ